MSAKYRLSVITFGQNRPTQQSHGFFATARQTERQTDRQTDKHTNKRTDANKNNTYFSSV